MVLWVRNLSTLLYGSKIDTGESDLSAVWGVNQLLSALTAKRHLPKRTAVRTYVWDARVTTLFWNRGCHVHPGHLLSASEAATITTMALFKKFSKDDISSSSQVKASVARGIRSKISLGTRLDCPCPGPSC